MLYSPHFNFLFVHIPKTGGTSIRSALKKLLYRDPWYWLMWGPQRLSHLTGHRTVTKFPRHAKVVAAKEMLPPEIYDPLFKFTVIRNPWDLQVSSYFHLKKEHPYLVEEFSDFNAFVLYKLSADRPSNYLLDISGTPQVDYLSDLHGHLEVKHLIRFEHLHEDYARILEKQSLPVRHELPHKRKGKRNKDYRSYYSDEAAERVASIYAADIKAFGYTFDSVSGADS